MYHNRRNSSHSNGFGHKRTQGPSRGFTKNHGNNGSKRRFAGTFNPTQLVKEMSFQPNIENEKYTAKHSFDDFEISPMLKKNIFHKGYEDPTPIQDQIIPHVIDGRDVIGIANTGTGKTAAFLIPLIDNVIKNPYTNVLILAPTRELAVQIQSEFESFADELNVTSVLCIGGVNMRRQQKALQRKCNFVIGTPGRIKDLIQTQSLNLNRFNVVVLDEADHMVDIGFIHDIKFIISRLTQKRQSLFFSATIDGKVKEILASFVQNPITVSVKVRETADNIEQEVIRVPDKHKKIEQLHDLLIKKNYDKVIIFGRTKWGVQKLSDELVKRGFKSDAIHGNKRQNQRQRTLENFKTNNLQILIATDVAARGLDIDNVSHVINYDMPASYEDYIHRIGRTGRANKRGTALTFVD